MFVAGWKLPVSAFPLSLWKHYEAVVTWSTMPRRLLPTITPANNKMFGNIISKWGTGALVLSSSRALGIRRVRGLPHICHLEFASIVMRREGPVFAAYFVRAGECLMKSPCCADGRG